MSIFKGNDIRGIYKKELTDQDAYKIGCAFVKFLKCNKVVVGRDHRLSSPQLAKSIISGVLDSGADVIDIGLVDSPCLYFASHMLDIPAIMVTASHNPPEHNGFYLCMSDARPIYKENGLKNIEILMKLPGKSQKKGSYKKQDIWKEYQEHILSMFNINEITAQNITIDAGNGVGSIAAEKIFSKIPQVKLTKMFFDLDGTFPNRASDTSVPENLAKLQEKVKKLKSDFGIAFDGDADRVSFIDEKARFVDGSIIGAIISQYLIKKSRKKETIVFSSRCNKILPETLKKLKTKSIMEKVGHSFMATTMRKKKALFGIEKTGHYFYKDNFYTESPIITSLLLLVILSKSKSKLSQLVKPFEKYYSTEEISFPVSRSNSLSLIETAIKKNYKRKIDKLDGLSVDCGSFWFSVRESQTEYKIRLALEGKSKSEVEKQKSKLVSIVKEAIK